MGLQIFRFSWWRRQWCYFLMVNFNWLKSEQQQEGHHKTEKPHGFGKSKSKNGIGEQLLLQARVSRVSNNQGTEYGPNTSSRAGNTDCSCTSSNEFCGTINILLNSRGVQRSQRWQRSKRWNKGHLHLYAALGLGSLELIHQRWTGRADGTACGDHTTGEDWGNHLDSVHFHTISVDF